jgi:hypothetical protein
MGGASSATLDSLARFDLIVYLNAPSQAVYQQFASRNSEIRVLMELQPQYVQLNTDPHPWWLADTLRSPWRAMVWACYKNPQWMMRDTSRRLIAVGGQDFLVNWTGTCPVGTYGSTKGLRPAQWYPMMLARVCLSGQGWRPISWDAKGTLNGVVFEILCDCLGSYGHLDVLSRADPDNDGQPEGVSHTCLNGGSVEPLSALMRGENAVFRYELFRRFPVAFPFMINENNYGVGPVWRAQLSGMKLENWDGDTPAKWLSWWYGDLGRGYQWAEASMGRSSLVPDRLKGWDLSILRMRTNRTLSTAENDRRYRFALGTALLGDGFFYLDPGNEKSPAWKPEYDRNLGVPLGDAYVLVALGPDTLWARQFTNGSVRVNPSGRTLLGVAPRSAVFR